MTFKMSFKKRFLFTLLMCIGMASSMSWVKMATNQGINGPMWHVFWLALGPTIVFAFIFNFFVVAGCNQLLVKWQTKGMTNQEAIGIKAGTIRGWTMLLMMSFTMSTRALLINGTLFHLTLGQFILGYFGTLTMAYFIRDVIVLPLVRKMLFRA